MDFTTAPGEVTAPVGVGTFGQHPVDQSTHTVALLNNKSERLERNDRHGTPFAVFEFGLDIPFAIPFTVGAIGIVTAGSGVGVGIVDHEIITSGTTAEEEFHMVAAGPFIHGHPRFGSSFAVRHLALDGDIHRPSVVDDLDQSIFGSRFLGSHSAHGSKRLGFLPDAGIEIKSGESFDLDFGNIACSSSERYL